MSDGSQDATVATATDAGASVYDLNPNRGKAGALAAAIQHFALAERFEVVMLLDADTVLSADYMRSSLNMFDDPDVVAIAGRAATVWDKSERLGFVGSLLRAYRERLYVLFQVLLKYGQASRLTNAVTIVPGFASMYRTRILSSIDIDAPGLAIEDFNMTFEVHARRLGRIAFHPGRAIAYTQDPHTLRDYSKQVERWSLGFWQTLRRPARGPLLVPPGGLRGRGAHQQRRVRDARSGPAAERRRTAVAVARRPRRRWACWRRTCPGCCRPTSRCSAWCCRTTCSR